MKPALAALALFLALAPAAPPLQAADEPEVVYARFHRAVLAGNIRDMKRDGTAAGGAEIDKLPPDQAKAILGFMRKLMPKTYVIAGKDINPNGMSATLRATARAADTPAGGSGTIRGTIRMQKEGGEWKVEESNWETGQVGGVPVPPKVLEAMVGAQKESKTESKAPAQRSAAPAAARKAPTVGALDAAPERKLGAQKPPCVYKPVMTDAEIDACR